MLPRQLRIPRGKPFTAIARSGRTVRGRYAQLHMCATGRPSSRFSVVVSTKVSKSAVLRNALRRRVYEHIRSAHLAAIEPGYDVVVRIVPGATSAVPATLRNDVTALLRRAHLLPPYKHDQRH